MKRYRSLVMAVAVALLCALPRAGAAQDAGLQVYSDAGNIFIERNGVKTKLTTSEMDVDPVLSPERLDCRLYAARARPQRPRL